MSHSDGSRFIAHPGGCLRGTLRVPGDKSISHRSVMFGAIADGVTEVTGFLEGADALSTMAAFRAMGVRIDGPDQGRVTVYGVGIDGLKPPPQPLDCGNSGTTMRLLAGLLAGQGFEATLIGDESLSRRPMRRVADPLSRFGARIETNPDGRPPVRVLPSDGKLKACETTLKVASAQVKSALLLAGLYAQGLTTVTEPAPTRDHTERMLTGFGVKVQRDGLTASIEGGQRLTATRIQVPADISSSAFFMVGAAIAPGSDVLLEGVGLNPTRTGIIEILKLMNADLTIENPRTEGGEPVGDVRVRYRPLKGVRIPEELVPLAIDEFPALFVAASVAQGETLLTGAEELRVKESDRIQVMADGLQALGAVCEVLPDGMRLQGGATLQGATIQSHGDHRIAMSFAMAALVAKQPIIIESIANVATSFPNFAELARGAGLTLDVVTA